MRRIRFQSVSVSAAVATASVSDTVRDNRSCATAKPDRSLPHEEAALDRILVALAAVVAVAVFAVFVPVSASVVVVVVVER